MYPVLSGWIKDAADRIQLALQEYSWPYFRMNASQISVAALRKAVTIKMRLEKLQAELTRLLGASDKSNGVVSVRRKKGRRRMGAAARARIAASARARWRAAKAAGKNRL